MNAVSFNTPLPSKCWGGGKYPASAGLTRNVPSHDVKLRKVISHFRSRKARDSRCGRPSIIVYIFFRKHSLQYIHALLVDYVLWSPCKAPERCSNIHGSYESILVIFVSSKVRQPVPEVISEQLSPDTSIPNPGYFEIVNYIEAPGRQKITNRTCLFWHRTSSQL